jgi:hypothetical protein
LVLNEGREFPADGGGISGDPYRLQTVARARDDGEGPSRQVEDPGQKLDSGFIGLALFRLRPDFDLERQFVVGAGVKA